MDHDLAARYQSIAWTDCPAPYPGFDQRSGLLLRARSGSAPITGRPGPADQRVFANVVDEVFRLAAAIACGVFYLNADLADGLALPRHFARRKLPCLVPRHAAGIEVRILVTDRTAHRRQAAAVRTALDRRLVKPAFICLMWAVAGRMAINAARMGQHLAKLREHGGRARLRVADRPEALGRSQCVGRGLRGRVTRQHACRQGRNRNQYPDLHLGFHLRSPNAVYARDHALQEVAIRIGQDHVPHGLMIFDVAGATADMAVERLSDGFLKLGTCHRLFRQTLKQNLALVQKARGAVAALKGKMVDESFLQGGKLAVFRMAFDRANRLAVEARCRNDAGRAGVAGAVGIIDDYRAAQALRGAAAELGAGHPEHLS